MEALDQIYFEILTAGLIAVRDAGANDDTARCRAEAEHIHNIPSLIGEQNIQRHLYYATVERRRYLDWVVASGRQDVLDYARLAYSWRWKRMDEILGIASESMPWEEGKVDGVGHKRDITDYDKPQ